MKRITSALVVFFMIIASLSSCGGEAETEDKSEATVAVDMTEYAPADGNDRVFYEIFVGSFSDSDGDGTGDIRGIINRFDYLNDGDDASGKSLGVEGLWLTPIYKSPSYHKYDVTDYYEIDSKFGTKEDLKELIALCHERNVKLILDLPINHTGIMNQWYANFVVAHREGKVDDKFYDFYCFYSKGDEVPAGRAFGQISGTDDYYECNFSGSMPELDFDNPDVRDEVLNIAKYYLDLGVDGFRFDAAKYIYFGDNAKSAEFWVWYIDELKKINPDVYTVAEVWDGDGITDRYYPALNCCNFTGSQSSGRIADTAKGGDAGAYSSYVGKYIERVKGMREDATIVPFVSNHDMDRAAGFLTVASGNMQMAANLYLLGPGSPFIYYGEEIGMRGSRGGAQTDANRRLAMLWGDGDTVADPQGTTYSADSQTDATVVTQKEDPNSLYNYYKELILIRKANPEIARGEYKPVSVTGTKVGGFTATYGGKTVLVLHNTSVSRVSVDLSAVEGGAFTRLAAEIGTEETTLEGASLSLGAKSSAVIRIAND